MKKHLALLIALIFIVFAVTLVACDKSLPAVDYEKDNDFEVVIEDGEDALVFSPKGARATVGLIFYVGTAIDAKNYAYLGESLAKQGYLAVFPKVPLAFYGYKPRENAFERFKDVRFFLGGHSQGGGAAIRRAQEAPDRTAGLILLAPLCYKNNGAVYNGGGDVNNRNFYNVAEIGIPSLILHAAGDHVLTKEQQEAVFDCVDMRFCEAHTIAPGAHMSFSTADSNDVLEMFGNDGDGISEQEKAAQREATINFVLAFLKNAHI